MKLKIKTVTVIGANGTVGKEVSGIFASFGDAKVYMVSRNIEKSQKAVDEAALSVKALSIKENLIPKSMEELKECVEESDLVFESVSENLEIKTQIHQEINKYMKDTCIVSSGTSGLSIDKLAESYSENLRENFYGIHFFNPPYNLTLCELIPSKYNNQNKKALNDLKKYLENKLFRSVIIVKNEPAFIGNRIGFKFMNEALQYAEKYKEQGGVDYIDAILGSYTGRNMPPIKTADFVGLDIHKAIVDNIYSETEGEEKESFKLPEYVNKLIKNNKLGVKVNEGLYKKDNSKTFVYDIKTGKYREKNKYNFEFKNKAISNFKKANYIEGFNHIIEDTTEESKICLTFLLKYIIYSIEIAQKFGEKISDCDIAMATGFNWIPPLSLIKALGGKKETIKLCQKYLDNNQNYEALFQSIKDSNFDFRKYIKAKD